MKLIGKLFLILDSLFLKKKHLMLRRTKSQKWCDHFLNSRFSCQFASYLVIHLTIKNYYNIYSSIIINS